MLRTPATAWPELRSSVIDPSQPAPAAAATMRAPRSDSCADARQRKACLEEDLGIADHLEAAPGADQADGVLMGQGGRPSRTRGLHVELLQDLHAKHHIAACQKAKRYVLFGPLANVEVKAVEEDRGGPGFEVVHVTPAAARPIAAGYQTWGKGIHPAGLNFEDCFACEVAREHDCPLLFVGDDFFLTDIPSRLRRRG